MTSFWGNMEKRNLRSLKSIWMRNIHKTFLDITVSLTGGKVTTNLYVKHTDIAINISNLLHVTHITTRNKFHRARLFVLTESVQIVIHLTEDAMI